MTELALQAVEGDAFPAGVHREAMPEVVGQSVSQRQDSLTEQMWTVIRLAEQEGCWDAADWLRARFGNKYERHGERRGGATNRQAQAPLPASVSAEDQPTTGSAA